MTEIEPIEYGWLSPASRTTMQNDGRRCAWVTELSYVEVVAITRGKMLLIEGGGWHGFFVQCSG